MTLRFFAASPEALPGAERDVTRVISLFFSDSET